jgi:phage terminase large subunit
MSAVLKFEDSIDFKNPDYAAIFRERAERLNWLKEKPGRVESMKTYYRGHYADFISDWGITLDTRNRSKGRPAYLPFILFPKQRELIQWFLELWRSSDSGMVEKSRDQGASWLAMALSASMCILDRDINIGFGSATEDKIDRTGDPDTLFYKGRMFIDNLPPEFRPQYESAHMRISVPATNGSITGGAGPNAFRSGRKAMGFLDESAFIANPLDVDSSLSAATDCRIDISSVSIDGMANHFAVRRHSGRVKVFTMHWRDDPRKDEAWAEKKRNSLDPIVWAADYDLDYMSSAEGVFIPQIWVQAAVDAHVKLRIKPTGARQGALDVADEGVDLNCFAARHGILVFHCEAWSGKGSDIFATTEQSFLLCDQLRLEGFDYDSDGLGADVRGDARVISERRKKQVLPVRKVTPYRSSAGVFEPKSLVPGTDRTAEDMFQNFGAQAMWLLRGRFYDTFQAVNGKEYDPENLISLDSAMPELQKLCIELSQPQRRMSETGKLAVKKKPEGAESPNRCDAIRILFAPKKKPMMIRDDIFNEEF